MNASFFLPLSSYDLEAIARSLDKPSRNGRGWVARCPAHDDTSPSLSLSLGSGGILLAHCHAGCPFEEIILALKQQGLLPDHESYIDSERYRPQFRQQQNVTTLNRSTYARKRWEQSQPPKGTQVERYLKSRLGEYLKDIPATLRFLPDLRHGLSGQSYPCMVAAVQDSGEEIIAIHRTYLQANGQGKAPVEPAKMLLGNARGGTIKLAPATQELILCEGIEDGLSLHSILGKPVWVAGSATLLESIVLPSLPLAAIVHIAPDNDDAGKKVTEKLGCRLYAEGRTVNIMPPPLAYKDFNEILHHNNLQPLPKG